MYARHAEIIVTIGYHYDFAVGLVCIHGKKIKK